MEQAFYKPKKSHKEEIDKEATISPSDEIQSNLQEENFCSCVSSRQSSSHEDDDALKIIQSIQEDQEQKKPVSGIDSWIASKQEMPYCVRCHQAISCDPCIAFSLKFHPEHFTCHNCGISLTPDSAKLSIGDIYCQKCISQSQPMQCHVCGVPENQNFIRIDGFVFCPDHFKCETCGKKLSESQYFQIDGHFYCSEHSRRKKVLNCAKCGSQITAHSIFAAGKSFHPGCFCCNLCNENLAGQQYTLWKNQPICKQCFSKLPRHIKQVIVQNLHH